MRLIAIIGVLTVLITVVPVSAEDHKTLFRENFENLVNWKPFTFPKIKSHSTYTIERTGSEHILRAESKASASVIVYKDSFNIYDYPKAKWRWKVKNVYARGDVRSKEGDDYPIRIYFMFEYDPKKAGVLDRLEYRFAKSLYGDYPPHSSLNYIWSSRNDPETFVVSPYTDRSMMVLLEKGRAKVGTWVDEEIDILADYQKAFKKKPPARARIAIMNDSDNTGESSVSWLEYIEVFK